MTTPKRPLYVYAKPSGRLFFKHPKSGKLPLPPLDAPDFTAEYQRLMASVANNTLSLPVKIGARHLGFSGAASVGGLAQAYFASEPFDRLGGRTSHMRRLYIEQCLRTLHPEPMADGKPADFAMWHLDEITKDVARALRGALVYARTANGRPLKKGGDLDNWRDTRMWAMRAMFSWAIDKPYKWQEQAMQRRLNANPFQRLGDLDQNDDGHRTWEQEDFEQMMAFLKLERRWVDRLALAIMRYALVRRSDVVRLGWDRNVRDLAPKGANAPKLHLVFKEWKGSTSKTERRQNKQREIPILPQLQAIIDETPGAQERSHFVIGRSDKPLTSNHWGTRFNLLCIEADLPEGSTTHGIRHFAATTMAHNEASAHLIAAWGGWEDLRNVIRYTKKADKRRLTDAGARFVV